MCGIEQQASSVTYALAALRSLLSGGLAGHAAAAGDARHLAVAAVGHTLAFLALRGRVSRR